MTYNTQFESTIHDSMGSHSPTGINVRSRSYLKMDVPRSDVSGKGGGGLEYCSYTKRTFWLRPYISVNTMIAKICLMEFPEVQDDQLDI